jgi:hypothetical protein
MEYVLIVIALFGLMLLVKRVSTWNPGEVPLFTYAAIISALYFFGLAGLLLSGVYILVILGCYGFASGIFQPKHRKDTVDLLLDQGFLYYLALVAILCIKLLPFNYSFVGDDATYWGVDAAEMFKADSLRNSATTIGKIFHGNTEGLSLFIYFISKITHFSPAICYVAKNILLFSPVCLFSRFTKNSPLSMLLMSGCYVFLLTDLDWAHTIVFNNLLTDPIIGSFFGGAIVTRLGKKEFPADQAYFCSILCFTLFLIRTSGQLFSIMLGMFCICDYCRVALSRREKTTGTWRELASWKLGLPVLALLAGFAIMPKTWEYHLVREGLHDSFPVTLSLQRLQKSLSDDATDRDRCVRTAFWEAFGDSKTKPALLHSNISIREYLVLLSVFGLIFLAWNSALLPRGQLTYLYLILLAGLTLYILGLFILYLYTMPLIDGCSLGGFRRYMATFLLSISIITLGMLASLTGERSRMSIACYFVLFAAGIYLCVFSPPHIWYFIFNTSYPQYAL